MFMTRCRLMLAAFLLFAGNFQSSPCALAGNPSFPWHAHSTPPMGQLPVRVLSAPAQTPLETLPSKQPYPYGWFGRNPTPQWQRSFGSSKIYTQWSRN